MISDKTNLLVVTPHPDDETLGCGGLIQRVFNYGGSVTICLFSTFGYCGVKWNGLGNGYKGYCVKERCVKERGINLISAPCCSYHQDHNIINEAVRAVTRPHFYSGDVIEYSVGTELDFIPNFFVTLNEEEVEIKKKAFEAYSTQISENKHALSVENLIDRLKVSGRLCYHEYAEGYKMVRQVL